MISPTEPKVFKPEDSVMITQPAVDHFLQLLDDDTNTVRLMLIEDGCSGYKYEFNKEHFIAPSNGDLIIKLADSRYLIVDGDRKSMMLGTHIKLLDNGLNKEIVLENPNVVGQCGCGESVLFNET